jgi:hypothetical protein
MALRENGGQVPVVRGCRSKCATSPCDLCLVILVVLW